jgi:hypothetical protein
MNPIILTISLLLFIRIEVSPTPTNKKTIYKTFKGWNLATLQSIKDQMKQTADPKIKLKWRNRLDVERFILYSSTGDKNGITNKGKPSRYKFLKAIAPNMSFDLQTYVIESYTSGEIIQSRNYFIQNSLNFSHVEAFNYYKDEWVKVKDTVVTKIDFESEFIKDNTVTNYFKGNNITDVIISEFDSSIIKTNYYISLSLNTNSSVQKILKMWDNS